MNEAQLMKKLRLRVDRYKLLKQAAADMGVTSSYLSAILRGRKRPSIAVFNWLGVKETKTVVYSYEVIQ